MDGVAGGDEVEFCCVEGEVASSEIYIDAVEIRRCGGSDMTY